MRQGLLTTGIVLLVLGAIGYFLQTIVPAPVAMAVIVIGLLCILLGLIMPDQTPENQEPPIMNEPMEELP